VRKRVVLHIGTMKSGSTYVQSLLASHSRRLDESGVHVVGIQRGAGNRPAASHGAANELVGGADRPTRWAAVVDEIRGAAADTVVVTSEFFGFLKPEGIRRLTADLEPFDLTVVLGVRDQLTAIPAQWQTYSLNTGTASFVDYLRQIAGEEQRDRRTRAHRTFHRAQDVPRVLERWTVPGVDRLVAFTVPAPGAPYEELWRRFVSAAALPEVVTDFDDVVDNPSLGYEACEYLCRLNRHLADLPRGAYRRAVRPLGEGALLPLRAAQHRPRLDRAAAQWARERNEQARIALSTPTVELVGDLTDLPVDVDPAAWPDRSPAPDADLIVASALAALRWTLDRAGVDGGSEPADLDRIVAETARLLVSSAT
jgi:hypothetical protein